MPRRTTASAARRASAFSADTMLGFAIWDGTEDFGCLRRRTFTEAAELWPRYRRAAWLRTFRLSEPGGAKYHDGLELQAGERWHACMDLLWSKANVPEVQRDLTAAIAADRRALARYRRQHGDELGDVLDLAERDLAALKRHIPTVLALAGDDGAPWFKEADGWRQGGGWRYGEALNLLDPEEE